MAYRHSTIPSGRCVARTRNGLTRATFPGWFLTSSDTFHKRRDRDSHPERHHPLHAFETCSSSSRILSKAETVGDDPTTLSGSRVQAGVLTNFGSFPWRRRSARSPRSPSHRLAAEPGPTPDSSSMVSSDRVERSQAGLGNLPPIPWAKTRAGERGIEPRPPGPKLRARLGAQVPSGVVHASGRR